MIKVVIVDDEPKLRQGLQTLIPWESLGFTVIAAAANGKEALKVIEEKTPDVVIVDIRMPVMDGLQLIEHLTSDGHHLHFMILSGYADFEYAKQAIKYGVVGYLLKPVDVAEMSANLKRIRERIEEERLQGEWREREIMSRDFCLHSLLIPQEKTEDPAKLRSKAKEADLLWTSYEVVVVYPRVSEVDRADVVNRLSIELKPKIEGQMMGLVTVIPPIRSFCSTSHCAGENDVKVCITRFVTPLVMYGSLLQPEGECLFPKIFANLFLRPRKQ